MSEHVAFNQQGLIPAVLQHAETGEVLMMAWMNQEALRLTLETGQAHFWSRSRETLWHKGATSGSFMNVRDIRIDCDGDTLLVQVEPEGPACHTGEPSCFYRRLPSDPSSGPVVADKADRETGTLSAPPAGPPADETEEILDELFAVILHRRDHRPAGSYTAELFDAGEDEILKKVGEEAMELVLAAKGQGDGRVVSEAADLVYHLLVLLASRRLRLSDVGQELKHRRR